MGISHAHLSENLPSSDSEQLDANTISQLSSNRRRLEYIIQLSKSLTATASGLLDAHQRRLDGVSMKLSKGLASLPGEILAIIFKFATLHEQEGTRHALWLSHVSRRFRGIALDSHDLWSTLRLWRNTTKECIASCISRSGKDTDLQIVIDYGSLASSVTARDTIDTILPSSPRWRVLSMSSHWDETEGSIVIGHELRQFMEKHDLVLPRLYELCLSQRHSVDSVGFLWAPSHDFFNIHRWQTPNLQVLRCSQYIPPPSFPFTIFTSFSLSLMVITDYAINQVAGLVKFLSSKPNIRAIDLELDSFFDFTENWLNPIEIGSAVCPSVTTFRLKLINSNLVYCAGDLVKQTLRALQMPNLESFSLSLELGRSDIDEDVEFYLKCEGGPFPSETGHLLPSPGLHPRLTSLTIDIPTPILRGATLPSNAKDMVFSISLDKVPHVSRLSVMVFCQLAFTIEGKSRPDSVAQSRLQELELHSCGNMSVEGLRETVQSLKDAGAWDTLDHVTIQNCDLLDYGPAFEIIGKDKLRFCQIN